MRSETRRGTPCQCPAMANVRCRLHGGLSTGPKKEAGVDRVRQARLKHGRFTKEAKAERCYIRELILASRSALKGICERPLNPLVSSCTAGPETKGQSHMISARSKADRAEKLLRLIIVYWTVELVNGGGI
jgi:hypothetical protein